jgi:succinoglycan biosynthesis transport protein ExoP
MDMLAHRPGGDYGDAGAEANAPTSIGDLIERLAGLARRQYRVFLIGPAAAIALGLLYLLVTPAKYTATATLLIDSSTLRVLQNQLQPQGDIPLDSLQVGSQVEVLASRNLGLAVISALKLDEDPEFIGSGSGLPSPFSRPGFDASTKTDREKRALDEFLSLRTISRMERTYALNLSYTSQSRRRGENRQCDRRRLYRRSTRRQVSDDKPRRQLAAGPDW